MADLDRDFKIAAHSSGRELCWLRGVRPDTWTPIGDTLQTTERLADRAFRATEGAEAFVVYFEAYTAWREPALLNLLAKSALLSERERLPTETFVFVLTPDGYHEHHGTFQLRSRGHTTQQVWFHEICLWRERPEAWWEQVPGLMALLPLCDHGFAEEAVVKHAARAITATVPDTVVRANLLVSLSCFGKLVYPQLDVASLIGRENMRESPFVQELLAEGRGEGGLVARRADILEVLGIRFGAEAAAEFTEPLNRIQDLEQLRELVRVATKCRGVAGFRRALGRLLP